jgi:translation initiation factor IF-2
MRRLERQAEEARRQEATATKNKEVTKTIKVTRLVTVRDFATLTGLPINKILAELMKNGIFTSLNEKIDYETAVVIGADLGIEVVLSDAVELEGPDQSEKIKEVLNKEASGDMKSRAPVIVVMGHVDHGKTKLLDAIRNTNVVEGEAGGITQHIGAYQVVRNERAITFIDTPGHEAFTAMRNRGAKVADIAILVVAADDGVKPQTVEAYRIIEAAKIPFVVAINKIDKPDANIEKVKQELSNQLKLVPEEWGGKTVCAPVSAKEGTGITDILDTLLLIADMEADNLKANPDASGMGTVIESKVDQGEGVIATVLVQNGTLRVGDDLSCSGMNYGRARALKNYLGQTVSEALPSTPVKVIGFKVAPAVGDIIEVGQGTRVKQKSFRSNGSDGPTLNEAESEDGPVINLILKTDALGSGEAIEGSLSKIDTQGVKVKIILKSLGHVSESDIGRAEASQAQIICFNVKASPQAEEQARNKKVVLKSYKIIYDLLNDLKAQIQELVKPEINRVDTGKLKVAAIFRSDKKGQIVGGRVIEGLISRDSLIEVFRNHELLASGQLAGLKMAKEEVDQVELNHECGISYVGAPVIEVGDTLQIYREEKIFKKVK